MRQISDVIPENVFMVLAGNKLDSDNNRYSALKIDKSPRQKAKNSQKIMGWSM
jgi:hypothetical protein